MATAMAWCIVLMYVFITVFTVRLCSLQGLARSPPDKVSGLFKGSVRNVGCSLDPDCSGMRGGRSCPRSHPSNEASPALECTP